MHIVLTLALVLATLPACATPYKSHIGPFRHAVYRPADSPRCLTLQDRAEHARLEDSEPGAHDDARSFCLSGPDVPESCIEAIRHQCAWLD